MSSCEGDDRSRLIDELTLMFPNQEMLNLTTFCSGCLENTHLFPTELPMGFPKNSKYANDSYKKLKRDSKGHFIKANVEMVYEIDNTGLANPVDYERAVAAVVNSIKKSKFANDSYKKLKRDSKGHFIKMEDCNSNNMKENCNCNTCKGFEELLNDLAPKRISGNLDDEDECNCEDCYENPDCEGHKLFTTFELGYNDGRHDMLHGHNPTYISSDINIIGDSDYIEGYIDGFNSLPI